ncbi:hypothetical protein BDW66DRAFT_125569 [Aspergillus desertorum]
MGFEMSTPLPSDPDGLQTLQVEGEEEETIRNARKTMGSTKDTPNSGPESSSRVADCQ